MLNKDVFIKGLGYLKACYVKWELDLNSPIVIETWYNKFSRLTDNQYRLMIEEFTDNNKFPPQSTADLLSTLKNVYTSVEMNPDDAWKYVLDLMSEYSFNYHPDKIYQALEDKPALKKTVETFENQLYNLKTSDSLNVSKEFKRVYKENLDNYSSKKVETLLSIGNNKQKLLN